MYEDKQNCLCIFLFFSLFVVGMSHGTRIVQKTMISVGVSHGIRIVQKTMICVQSSHESVTWNTDMKGGDTKTSYRCYIGIKKLFWAHRLCHI
jgi:hypothetical protein